MVVDRLPKGSDRRIRTKVKQEIGYTDGGSRIARRDEFVERCYREGGKLFLNACRQYGCNEQGDPLRITDWYAELLELIGDFRVGDVYTSGCSQIGKTLSNTLLVCHCLTEGKINTLWSYDQQTSRDIQVPSNFRPVIRGWLRNKQVEPTQQDAQNNSIYQVLGATSQFVYVSTSKDKQDGMAAAGGIAVGVSRDILFKEERSQCPPGSTEPLHRRLDASRLPSRPIREIGTPGSGLGIEASIKQADYQFYPHGICPHCQAVIPLDPKGCLLKAVEQLVNNRKTKTYLSETGRPIQWFHQDEYKSVESAFFGCSRCGKELPPNSRDAAFFQCRKTGIKLRSFLDDLKSGEIPHRRISCGITLSPLLRVEKGNTAAAIIREGLETRNTNDWQQQRLGHESQTSKTNISLEMILDAISAPPAPSSTPKTVTLAGCDQGRAEDWLIIVDYHLPANSQDLSTTEKIEQTIREVCFASGVARKQIPMLLQHHGAEYGLIDNEPDIPDAAKLCAATCLELADQKSGGDLDLKQSLTRSGGEEFTCWHIRQEDFLKQVLAGFLLQAADGHGLYRMPSDWERWIGVNSERSPLVHLMAPSCDPATGRWKRAANHVDHLYYALMFCEAAFYIWLTQNKQSTMADLLKAVTR
jgi:hypothetical protein